MKIPQRKLTRKERFTMEYRRFGDKIVVRIDRAHDPDTGLNLFAF